MKTRPAPDQNLRVLVAADKIKADLGKPGERLPSLDDLTDSYGLAREIARQARRVLAARGHVTTQRGAYVVADPDSPPAPAPPAQKAPTPKVQHAADLIRRDLSAPGLPVPSARTLAARYSTGLPTVRSAMQLLDRQGHVTRKGTGYIVASPHYALRMTTDSIQNQPESGR